MGNFKAIIFLILFCVSKLNSAEHSVDPASSLKPLSSPYSVLLIEEGENSLGVYHSESREEIGRVKLNFYPHEIEVSEDMKRAFVSNFGIRDYDAKIGFPGNSISVIDLENFCEISRLYTCFEGKRYWGPHGLSRHPDGKRLFVNVECVKGRFPTSNNPQESVMLIFDLEENEAHGLLPPPPKLGVASYPILAGTHNFLFAPNPTDSIKPNYRDIWYYAGTNGVSRINSDTGKVLRHYPTNAQHTHHNGKVFNGAVRGLAFNPDGTRLLVSATNEISIIDVWPNSGSFGDVIQQIRGLGVAQLFYSKFVPKTSLILAPAARESQVLVIDTTFGLRDDQRVVSRIITGVDPLQVKMSPLAEEKKAFVTNADSPWVSEIDLKTMQLTSNRIVTKGGANGIAFTKYLPPHRSPHSLKFGVCLPFSGEYAAEGRECFLGIQFWQEVINNAGGIVFDKVRYKVEICYGDTGSTVDEELLISHVSRLFETHEGSHKYDRIVAMFGSYPSSANLPIAKFLSERSIPLVTSTARDPNHFCLGLRNLFGIAPIKKKPDLVGTFQAIYRSMHPKPRTAMILACNDQESMIEAEALEKYIIGNGVKVLAPADIRASEESSIIAFPHYSVFQTAEGLDPLRKVMLDLKAEALESCQYYPDLLFISGHRKESAVIIEACDTLKFSYGVLALNAGIRSHHFLRKISCNTENIMGSVNWSEDCVEFAKDRFVSSSDFERMFYNRYSESPSDLVAGFAACGVVIEESLKWYKAHSRDPGLLPNLLMESIRNVNLSTFYGPVSFDECTGENTEKKVISVQLRTIDSKTKGVIIWPEELSGENKPIF